MPAQLRGRIRAAAVVAVAAAVGFVVWLVIDPGGDSSEPQGRTSVAILSKSGVRTLANSLNQPIYWAGRQPGTKLEVTQVPNGRIYLRYLPKDAKAGDRRTFLTVGTYPMGAAFAVVQAGTRQHDAVPIAVDGGVAMYHRGNPRSVYVAFPGSNYQIEVYSPRATEAQNIVAANRVRAIANPGAATSTPTRGPVAVSIAQLKALSASLGHPVYWAGSQPNVTYELTRTSNRRIYVRYLPEGVPVGAHKLYLTIGTYPVRNAFTTTRAAAGKGTSIINLQGGAIAVFAKRRSTHVYLAYPRSNFQIEIFDPTPNSARRLVAAERISPVR